jgi:hypothetical protein
MVSKTLSRISWVWGIVSASFLVLVSLFSDEIRSIIISTLGVSSEIFVFYALVGLAVLGLGSSLIILANGILKRHEKVTALPAESEQRKVNYDRLREIYSPIHAMIVRVNRKIPRETALQLTVGTWVNASLIDFDNVSAIFKRHSHELRNRDLEMWLEIEDEIKERKGFWLGGDRQKWFDELEAEYNHLTGALSLLK